ncbi:MAG TPA: MoxR family ATPase [Thermodesulfobacteriota bacterium]|nr:MoxR family ATPase [Thermodesulfobacteriota bacterium]
MEAAKEYQASDEDLAQVEEMGKKKAEIISEIRKVIVGQEKAIEEILIALFCMGHCLLVGVPGLAKTLLISTLAGIMELNFNRVQFTPDLMPSDITGTDILEEEAGSKRRSFRFLRGPIFTNILLADEINRTPPKTQAALLQAMQEYKVTAGGVTHFLDLPFFVLATQNPIEQEGTYPLPEAQLDRFMFNINIDYPPIDQEMEIVATTTSSYQPVLNKVINGEKILAMQQLVRRVPVSSHVIGYAVNLVRSSRPRGPEALPFVKEWVEWGAGPRASQHLILTAKARAVMHGRYVASVEDVKAVIPSILRHRIITNFKAQAEGITSLDIIERLLNEVKP